LIDQWFLIVLVFVLVTVTPMAMPNANRIATLTLFLLAVGCADSNRTADIEKVVPVSGTLTFQGKPLEQYRVTFLPTDGRRAAVGITDVAGKFVLGTNDVGDGAPAGKHKVAIVWAPPASAGTPGQEAIVDDLSKLPKPKIKIPDKYGNPETSGLEQEIPAGGVSDLKIDLQ
jgi:hypothetical protein